MYVKFRVNIIEIFFQTQGASELHLASKLKSSRLKTKVLQQKNTKASKLIFEANAT